MDMLKGAFVQQKDDILMAKLPQDAVPAMS